MLRGVRRRWSERREAPLACLTFRVLAVSPYPEEPDDEQYSPSLIVESVPAPGAAVLDAASLAYGVLLFVEWSWRKLGDPALPLRLRALLPRLRLAVDLGKVGPEQYAAHRQGQRERFFHHREAATYLVELRRDDAGVYAAVESHVAKGDWTLASTLLEAATVAPYEALLRLAPPDQRALLAWLERAVACWLDQRDAGFPVLAWEPAALVAPESED